MLGKLYNYVAGDESLPLQIRLFRLISLTTAFICLVIVLPVNAAQNLPPMVNVGDIILGLFAGYCFLAAQRGRYHLLLFFLVLLSLLTFVWFWNAGSEGSITFYFVPSLLYPIAIFRGRTRWIAAILLIAAMAALFVVEYHYPHLTVPFSRPQDRVLDLVSGVVCSSIALLAVAWLIIASYDRERDRIAGYAASLAVSERNYRTIFNASHDALFIHDEAGHILDVNDSMCALYGCTREEARRASVDDFSAGAAPYSATEARTWVERAVREGPQVFVWRSRRRDGELFWSEVALRATETDGVVRVIAAVRDISRRRQAEDSLRLQEERLRLALAASRQGWFDLNVQTGTGTASPEYVRLIGFDPATFQTNVQSWTEGIHPEDRAGILTAFQECIKTGGPRTFEYRRRTATGQWKWIRSIGQIVEYDAAGRPLRMAGTHADITDRKLLEERLLQSQRLEAVATLASGAAHDLNNILTPMLMASGVLQEKLADPNDRKLMALLDGGARRGAAIVSQLLTFCRGVTGKRSLVLPATLVRDTARTVLDASPAGIKVVTEVSADTWPVEAEAAQLQQVMANLCTNAREAMPHGGTLTLAAANAQSQDVRTSRNPWAREGPHVVLTVSDTGHGIAPDIIGRIFDPFFTTKGIGQGTGLGLSTVHGIVRSHGGFVTVESKAGAGATFRVFLPAQPGAVAPDPGPAASPRPTPAAPAGRILVVDDELAVRTTTQRILEKHGLVVTAVDGGEPALAALQADPRAFRVAIVDVLMPGMDGPTLVPRLRQLAPSLRVIGVSGYDQREQADRLAALGFHHLLTKPYEMQTLVEAVRRQLAEPS